MYERSRGKEMGVNLKFSLLTASFNQPLERVQTCRGSKCPDAFTESLLIITQAYQNITA